jgi:hypothetical protein
MREHFPWWWATNALCGLTNPVLNSSEPISGALPLKWFSEIDSSPWWVGDLHWLHGDKSAVRSWRVELLLRHLLRVELLRRKHLPSSYLLSSGKWLSSDDHVVFFHFFIGRVISGLSHLGGHFGWLLAFHLDYYAGCLFGSLQVSLHLDTFVRCASLSKCWTLCDDMVGRSAVNTAASVSD